MRIAGADLSKLGAESYDEADYQERKLSGPADYVFNEVKKLLKHMMPVVEHAPYLLTGPRAYPVANTRLWLPPP